MSLLVALLVALGRLSGDREVVAMLACGLSPLRLLRPALALGVVAWAGTTWVMLWAIPDANQRFREITTRLVADRAEGEVKPRVFFEDFPGYVVYVREVPADGGWSGVLAADTRSPEHPVLFLARRGRMLVDRDKRTIQMVLSDGARHSTTPRDPDGYEVVQFGEIVLSLDPESVFPRAGPARGEREMTIAELRTRADTLVQGGHSPHNPLMEIHKKFSIPAACLVFALIGVALGASYRKDGKFASFVVGLSVIFLYWGLLLIGQSLAKGQYIGPWLGVWLPNVVLGAAGAAGLWRKAGVVRRRRSLALPAVGRAAARLRALAPASFVSRVPDLTWLRPTLLDLYVGLLYLRILGLGLAGMAGLFYISTFIDLSDHLFKGTATTGMLFAYLWWSTPQFVYYIIAIAVLLAAIVTIGALTKSSELIVMRACGISLYRTALPLLVAALASSAVLFALEERLLAPANRRASQLSYMIRGQTPRTFDVLNRKWLTGQDGALYHYQFYDPREQELNGLTVLRFAADDPDRVASRAFALTAKASPAASATTWQARDGWRRAFDDAMAITEYGKFETATLTLDTPETFVTEAPPPSQMNFGQLRDYVRELRASGYDVREDEVALHRKIAFPFVTLVMTLIGVPFAVTTGRRGALYGVGIGIVLALVYWTMISIFAAFGAGGAMPTALAAWAPNLLFGAGAVYLLLTVRT
jgi:LPS export ABC transporter permease LptG/LPS export ABC transporter permease LptF